jgi:hypothetical protein
VPTPVGSELPTASPPAAASGALLIRLTGCSDTCGPEPGTTILEDGRVIWQDPQLRPIEGRLTPEALEQVRAEIEQAGVLDVSADVQAELRPGAEPIGRGVSLYRFERVVGDTRVVVTSGDPRDYVDQAELWIIPPAMPALAALADKLSNPVGWLGAAAFAEESHRFEPEHYLLLIDLFPEVGGAGDFDVDVDAVPWPFGAPIEGAGEPLDIGGGGLGSRCLVLDAAQAAELAAAERGVGENREFRSWLSTLEYGWERADGFVQVSLTPLLPHQVGSCANLVTAPE